MTKGTYTLVIERSVGGPVAVGALGRLDLPAGWYAYTGSAFGPGGFDRIDRHERVAADEHETRHWHIDYLLGDDETAVDGVVRSAGVDIECAVARRLDGSEDGGRSDGKSDGGRGDSVSDGAVVDGCVAGFGCSDCECRSHLAYSPRRDELLAEIEQAHREL
ncbi:MAG: DUF123 domain-containing protein [Haloarculaceae archaeon]